MNETPPTVVTLGTYDAAVIALGLALLVLVNTAQLLSSWGRSS